jgi:hypothetical protein
MGNWQPFFWILGALLAIASLVMALARTPPNDAASNLSKWIDWVGLHRLATRLRSPAINRIVFRIGLISMGILLFNGGLGVGMWWTAGTNISVSAEEIDKPKMQQLAQDQKQMSAIQSDLRSAINTKEIAEQQSTEAQKTIVGIKNAPIQSLPSDITKITDLNRQLETLRAQSDY